MTALTCAELQRLSSPVGALIAHDRLLEGSTECMPRYWTVLWDEYRKLHALLVRLAGSDELLRRLCGIPGVGPVTAVTFTAAIDDPRRFAKSKTAGAQFGLTPKRLQSGTSVDVDGQISRRGDGEVRTALDEAASAMITRSKQRSALKAWGTQLAAKRAVIAVARKLAVVRHCMWIDGTAFRVSAVARDGERRIGTSAAVAQAA